MRNVIAATGASCTEKVIRKAGSAAVVMLFMLNEGLHFGLRWGFLVASLAVIAALGGFMRARTFSRDENIFGLVLLAAAGASKMFFHAGDGTFELAIPWFIVMYLWCGVRVCSPEESRQISKDQPLDTDEIKPDMYEYRPGPDGTAGYYRNGQPIKFD
ncbi:hypothetical protein [Erwinia amylovora]|uniref:hypothetical protein n=1 Tax=Erwinia amylovora TaxID=552 RepID=UPI0020BE8707|nr:hypothetical protein [Erwinia amylovora]MCK8417606.1 hypothetical protein [Erwinia amylovora]